MDNIIEIESLHEEMEHRRVYGSSREGPEVRGVLESKGEVVIARDFLDRLGAENGHVGKHGHELLIYSPTTGVWEAMSVEEINKRIQKYQGYPHINSKGKQAPLTMGSRLTNGVVTCVFRDCTLVPQRFFDEAPKGRQFRNGFLRFRDDKAEMQCNSPRNGALLALPYDYDPEARCPRWHKFLAEIFKQDADSKEKAKTLQMFLGACLFGTATEHQRCLVFQGSGANGKSVFLEVVEQALFAGKRVTSCSPQSWVDDYHSADLLDSDMNIVTETPGREILASERFKAVITGDKISSRRPYCDVFNFRPRAGHIFACNALPVSNDDSHGYWRRFIVIEFNRKFDKSAEREKSRALINKLLAEAPGIMAWAIRGAKELEEAGEYVVPASHDKALKEWQLSANIVAAFVEDCCERETVDYTPLKTIYSDFCEYATSVGRRSLALNTLGQRLVRLGIPRQHTRTGSQYKIAIKQKGLWTAT